MRSTSLAAGRAQEGYWLRQIEDLPLDVPAAPQAMAPPAATGAADHDRPAPEAPAALP